MQSEHVRGNHPELQAVACRADNNRFHRRSRATRLEVATSPRDRGEPPRYSAQKCRFVIVGLNSNSGGESFTFEFRDASDSEVVVNFVLVAPYWSSDHDLASTIVTAELPLSTLRLTQLRTAIESWLKTDVRNADLLDGKHHLAASEDFVFDFSFGKRDDLISPIEKPVVTLQYKLGKLYGEFKLITDQSCLRDFAQGLKHFVTSIAE